MRTYRRMKPSLAVAVIGFPILLTAALLGDLVRGPRRRRGSEPTLAWSLKRVALAVFGLVAFVLIFSMKQ